MDDEFKSQLQADLKFMTISFSVEMIFYCKILEQNDTEKFMFSKKDSYKNRFMLTGSFARQGYDWWWHSFTARHERTGEEKQFFIEFFLSNPALSDGEVFFGQKKNGSDKKQRPSYLMVKAGCWGENAKQVHRFFPWSEVTVKKGAHYSVKAGDCYASDEELRGAVSLSDEEAGAHPEYMCSGGQIKWDIKINKVIPFNVGYGTCPFLCGIKAFEMYWHVQGMKSEYSGVLEIDGEKYVVDPKTSFGYADKNWGRNFTSPWVWISSCDLVSNVTGKRLEDSVFDIGGGCPKVYFVSIPRKLLGAFYYEGKEYEYNFSKFWHPSETKFECSETDTQIIWHVVQEDRKSLMETRITCEKRDMLFINYESPDGLKRHNRLWNGGNGKGNIKLYRKEKHQKILIDDISVGHAGCEYGEYC